uniref:PB1 domain-containing protein n=1 Tax=Anopheles quadriannulatus TaxID=34691 RepID=A0A182XFQ2_ANOQN
MPIQIANESNNSGGGGGSGHEIKVKIAYNGEVMITYIDESITYDGLCREMREICRFSPDQVFTMKWVDEENDPCTIQSDTELDEAIRLYEVNRDSELVIHVLLWQGYDAIYVFFRRNRTIASKRYRKSSTGWMEK